MACAVTLCAWHGQSQIKNTGRGRRGRQTRNVIGQRAEIIVQRIHGVWVSWRMLVLRLACRGHPELPE